MTDTKKSIHGEWSSRFAFILAATGSAVGLGNIWKFPYITGENGGGAFVIVYLLCIALIGIPIMMAETMLGRRGRQSPINTMEDLSKEAGADPNWHYLGWLGVVAGFLILSYYSVIAGWGLSYIIKAFTGSFSGADGFHGGHDVRRRPGRQRGIGKGGQIFDAGSFCPVVVAGRLCDEYRHLPARHQLFI